MSSLDATVEKALKNRHAADLLAVTGDPAERIGALGDVRLVLARGAIIKSP